LRDRLARIGGYVDQVRGLAATLRPAFARRLESRLKELLGGIGIEPARLAQEAALLAERSDISEELDRLKSHLQQFTKLLDGAGELGKKLDFLLQEMHREANTMLSKKPGVESEIRRHGGPWQIPRVCASFWKAFLRSSQEVAGGTAEVRPRPCAEN